MPLKTIIWLLGIYPQKVDIAKCSMRMIGCFLNASRRLAVAEKYKSVGIVEAYRLEGLMVSLDGLPYQRHFVPGREICRSTLLGGPYVFGTPTSLLIRSDIIRKREKIYDGSNFSIAADTAACYEILKDFDFGFVHQVLTYTRRHQEAEIQQNLAARAALALFCSEASRDSLVLPSP